MRIISFIGRKELHNPKNLPEVTTLVIHIKVQREQYH